MNAEPAIKPEITALTLLCIKACRVKTSKGELLLTT
jgi:hypothetical protein